MTVDSGIAPDSGSLPDTFVDDSLVPPAETASSDGHAEDSWASDSSTSDSSTVVDAIEESGSGTTVSSELGFDLVVVESDHVFAAGTVARGVYSIDLAAGTTTKIAPLGRAAALALDDTYVFWADGEAPTDGKLGRQLRSGGPTLYQLLPGEPVTGLAPAFARRLCWSVVVGGKDRIHCGALDFTDVTIDISGSAPIVGTSVAICFFDWPSTPGRSGCAPDEYGYAGGMYGGFGFTVSKGPQHRALATFNHDLWIVGDSEIGFQNTIGGKYGFLGAPVSDASAIAVDGTASPLRIALGTLSGRVYLIDAKTGGHTILASGEGPISSLAMNTTDVFWIRPSDGALRRAPRSF